MKRIFLLLVCVIAIAWTGCGGGNGGGTPPKQVIITITPATLPYGIVNQAYPGAQFQASGGTAPYTFSSANLPQGLALSTDGRLTGTTPNVGPTIYNFNVTARDSAGHSGSTPAAFNTYRPLGIWVSQKEMPSGVAYQGSLYIEMQENIAAGATIVSGSLPPGLQLSTAKATGPNPGIPVTGTPTQSGIFSFTAEATDSLTPPRTVQVALKMFVDVQELRFITNNVGIGKKGESYQYTIPLVGGTAPYSCALAPGSAAMPTGLNVGANCVVSGTPTQTGDFSFSVRATDSGGTQQQTADQAFTMTVQDPVKISDTLPDAITGETYDATVAISGGVPPYVVTYFTSFSGCHLVFDAHTLSVHGVPYVPGQCQLSMTVADSAGQYTTQYVSLTVKEGTFQVGPIRPPRGKVGVSYEGALVAVGGKRPLTWNVISGTLPPGVGTAPNGDDIRLFGVPTTAGDYPVTLQVTDSATPAKTTNISLTLSMYAKLPRNETVATADYVDEIQVNSSSSISPYADPADLANPDQDYYHFKAFAGETLLFTATQRPAPYYIGQFDPVMEIVDVNGQRFTTCKSTEDDDVDTTPDAFNDVCMDDDITPGTNRDSRLYIRVPGASGTVVDLYVHVLDFRGDARPDFLYGFGANRFPLYVE